MTMPAITAECPRCSGAGNVEWARHYASGVCFQCGGSGSVEGADLSDHDLEAAKIYGLDSIMRYSDVFTPAQIEANLAWAWRKFLAGVPADEVVVAVTASCDARQRKLYPRLVA